MVPKRKRTSPTTNGGSSDAGPSRAQDPLAAYATRTMDYELDSRGDTIVVLRPTTEPPAAGGQNRSGNEARAAEGSRASGQRGDRQEEAQEPKEVLYWLSSRHLVLASDYFQKLFEGPWQESGTSTFDKPRVLVVEEWREEAFSTLMNIFHERSRYVSRTPSLELVAEIAVLVDYYQCREAMDLYCEGWLAGLPKLRNEYNRDLILRLLVSLVFDDYLLAGKVCRRFLYHSRGPIQSLGLPIPPAIIRQLNTHRQNNIGKLLAYAYNSLNQIPRSEHCSAVQHICNRVLQGSLAKLLLDCGLLLQRPQKPYYGYSWVNLVAFCRSVPENELHCHMGITTPRQCTIPGLFKSKIEELQAKFDGARVVVREDETGEALALVYDETRVCT